MSRLALVSVVLLAALPAGAPRGARAEEEATPFVVATKEVPPFVLRGADGAWDGLAIRLWRRVAERAGLPAPRFEARDLEGILAAVAGGEVDAGIAAISVTPEREERVDFTHPYVSAGLGVAARVGDDSGSLLADLGDLLGRGLGLLLGALLVGLVVFGVLIWYLERRKNAAFATADRREGIGLGIWWSAIMLLGHKGVYPKTLTIRILAFGAMVCSLLLLSTLVGAIASVLTAHRLEDQVRGPDDLRHLRVVTVAETTSETFLRRQRIGHLAVGTLDEAVARVLDDRADVVVYDRPMLRYLAHRVHPERLRVLPVDFELQDYAAALPSDSPHREAVNRALLEIRREDWWQDLLFDYLGG